MTGRKQRSTPDPSWRDGVERFSDAVRQTIEFQRRIVDAGSSPVDLAGAYARFLRSDLAGYGQRVAELTVDYYRALAEASREYGEQFWEDLRTDQEPDSRPATVKPLRQVVELSGPLDSEVRRSFTLENTDDTTADVSVEIGLCRGPDGSAFAAPVSVDPTEMTIEPGGSRSVTIQGRLDSALLEEETVYRVPVRIHGPRPVVVDLQLTAAGSGARTVPSGFSVRCPACGRVFERKTTNLGLRAHKTPTGEDCPERAGRRA